MRPIKDLMASLTALTESSVKTVRKTAESPPRLSVIDVLQVVTGHSPTVCSHTLKTLQEQYDGLSDKITEFHFPGTRQRKTPVTCMEGITQIVMVLPGKAGRRVRKEAASVLVRYLGGDLSLVEEIARNHMAQQEMDDDDPARLSGQHVESERVKRAREDLTIVEFEGALKRRRVEKLQFCLDALEATGQADDRDRMRCTDMIRTVAFGSTATLEAPVDKEVCIRAVVNAAGRARESPQIDIKLGKLAKKLYLADHTAYTFPKKTIWACGQQLEANCWLESQRGYIERALAAL